MIHYKRFADDPEETLMSYRVFYFHRFPDILKWFYPKRYNGMVLFAARHQNADRSLSSSTHLFILPSGLDPSVHGKVRGEKNRASKDTPYYLTSAELYFFSASVFFHVLIPQVIAKMAGKDAARLFHKASGWPKFSAGLGGLVSAEQWLYESGDGLFPLPEESVYFNSLLEIILPFRQNEVFDLFHGEPAMDGNENIDYLHQLAGSTIQTILDEIASATREAMDHFKAGVYPTYYLSADEWY